MRAGETVSRPCFFPLGKARRGQSGRPEAKGNMVKLLRTAVTSRRPWNYETCCFEKRRASNRRSSSFITRAGRCMRSACPGSTHSKS